MANKSFFAFPKYRVCAPDACDAQNVKNEAAR